MILFIGSISVLIYFFCVGDKKNSDDKNITIVRRSIDNSSNRQTNDDAQIDQISAGLGTDISTLQINKDNAYLIEIIQDLKNF